MIDRPPWSSSTKLTIWLLLLGLGIYLLSQFRAVLIPLILAFILAYVLLPLVNFFQHRLGMQRGFASLLAYLALLVVFSLLPLILVPTLVSQSADLGTGIQRIVSQVETWMGESYTVFGQTIDPRKSLEQAYGSISGLLEPVFGQTVQVAIDIVSSLVWIIFILVIAFYLVKDSPGLAAWVENLVPPDYREDYLRLRSEIGGIWAAFFRGQITLALAAAGIFSVAGLILGLPFAIAMGGLAGLLEFLPSLGHGIWLSIAVLLALFAGSTWLPLPHWAFALLITGLHLIYQQFDLNYLIPRIIGRRVHLPPLVVILGIVSGALLAGVLGVVLAAPSIASLRVLGRYLYAHLLDQEPFPAPIASDLPPPNPHWWRKSGAAATKGPPSMENS